MNNLILLIVGMMIVTYIPRLLPFLMVSGKKLPPKLELFLKFIPYTAMGALVIPGVFEAIPGNFLATAGAIGFTFIYAWQKGGIIVPVVGSIAVSFLIICI